MPHDKDFRRDRYIRRNGQRLRTRMISTLQPGESETNAAFEQRMDQLAEQLEQMDGVLSVEYEIERRAGLIVECLFDVQHAPRPAAVIEDPRPAGGRSGAPRSGRGGRNN